MPLIKTFPIGAAVLLSMGAPDPAAAGWTLHCDDAVSAPFCRALAAALAPLAPSGGASTHGGPEVRFVPETQGDDHLTGHLVWTGPDGATGRGPTLTLSAVDAPLNGQMMRRFADEMIQYSGLPALTQ